MWSDNNFRMFGVEPRGGPGPSAALTAARSGSGVPAGQPLGTLAKPLEDAVEIRGDRVQPIALSRAALVRRDREQCLLLADEVLDAREERDVVRVGRREGLAERRLGSGKRGHAQVSRSRAGSANRPWLARRAVYDKA